MSECPGHRTEPVEDLTFYGVRPDDSMVYTYSWAWKGERWRSSRRSDADLGHDDPKAAERLRPQENGIEIPG
jgi:hypothetical protein